MPYRVLMAQRRLEWWLASYTTVWGLFLVLAPQSLDSPAYALARIWAPASVWGCSAALIGMFHWWALYINGRRSWSAHVRAAATVCNAVVFTLMLSAVFGSVWHGIAPASATLVMHLAPVWAAICAFWVAAHDSCSRLHQRREAHDT